MQTIFKLTILFLCISTELKGQESEIDRLIAGELKMTFPSIYFKHNKTDYAALPYTVDSCFKHIAFHFNDNFNSLVIWRDSSETEELTIKRINKLKKNLSKYIKNDEIEIHSVGNEQKISRQTIRLTSDSTKIKYLLILNSVFDISKTRLPKEVSTNESHILSPKVWCWSCWKNGFHLNKRGREVRKMTRNNKQNQKSSKKKKKRHRLVWTGWKTGFHWSTAG